MATTNFALAPCTRGENAHLFQSMIDHAGTVKANACKEICATCPLTEACLALGTWEGVVLDGIYGGLTKTEREYL